MKICGICFKNDIIDKVIFRNKLTSIIKHLKISNICENCVYKVYDNVKLEIEQNKIRKDLYSGKQLYTSTKRKLIN